MKEQSHKREMAAAVRGDFARLRERGVPTTISVVGEDEPGAGSPPELSPPAPEQKRSARFRLFRRR